MYFNMDTFIPKHIRIQTQNQIIIPYFRFSTRTPITKKLRLTPNNWLIGFENNISSICFSIAEFQEEMALETERRWLYHEIKTIHVILVKVPELRSTLQ